MVAKKMLVILALCVIVCLALGALTDAAYAQDVGARGGDKALAAKDGTKLGTKKFDADKLPGKLEMGLAAGSVIAMIAVFKWL
ncbi:MAG: hypothetical protein HYV26_13120 [Candidatus Hydrogenedentes bacterium]|nr:hypothetical protein [Candidatus Hydrogenedentota bacterium]